MDETHPLPGIRGLSPFAGGAFFLSGTSEMIMESSELSGVF